VSRPPRDILPPRSRRLSWLAIAVSLGLHSLLLLFRAQAWLPPHQESPQIILVPLGTEGPRAVDMPFREPSAGAAPRRPPRSGVSTLPTPETGPVPEPQPPQDTATVVAAPEPDTVAAPVGEGRGTARGHVGPALGDGKLWARPLPLPPRDLAHAVVRTNAELVDSAVTAIVQAYIDSVLSVAPANEPLPRWSTKVGDQQLGLDAQWIYLGPIKIPTALVAGLLNAIGGLPVGGSAEQSDYTRFRTLQQMREDVQYAARRAQTMADFKKAIKDLRVERERQREFEKNQRTPPAKKPQKADSTATPIP